MTAGEARPLSYRWAGRDEWMLVQNGDGEHHVLLVQPLFGELNRTRRLLRDVMRALARAGIGSTLPDLPGTGESPRPLAECGWEDWTGALAAAAGGAPHVAGIRGGALLDDALGTAPRWRLAPVAGEALLRDLGRAQAIGEREGAGAASLNELAGYRLSANLADRLRAAEPGPAKRLRTVRLEGDAQPADALLPGPALWRRAEPGHSLALAEAIAGDIAAWVGSCAG